MKPIEKLEKYDNGDTHHAYREGSCLVIWKILVKSNHTL